MGLKPVICGRPEKSGSSQEAHPPAAWGARSACVEGVGFSEQRTPLDCLEYADQGIKAFKKTKSQPLNKTGNGTQFQLFPFSPGPLFSAERMLLYRRQSTGCSVGPGRGPCSYNLPTPCALRLGVWTPGLDVSCQGCQSSGTEFWEEPANLGLSSICLAKHLWLL